MRRPVCGYARPAFAPYWASSSPGGAVDHSARNRAIKPLICRASRAVAPPALQLSIERTSSGSRIGAGQV